MPELPLKRGSTGDDVKRVQRSIVRDGYRSAANDLGLNGAEDVDGIFGPRTETAVRRFQSGQGIVVDGVVGSVTWAALPLKEPAPGIATGARGATVTALQTVLARFPQPGLPTTPRRSTVTLGRSPTPLCAATRPTVVWS